MPQPGYVMPGFQADPNAPGMQEVLQWLSQQQGGKMPPLKGMPPGLTPDQQRQFMIINMLRNSGDGFWDPAQQGRAGGNPMPQEVSPPSYGR